MISSTKPTDAGGPAARQGFKYQDHVAAQCLLKMFADRNALRVECETSDDIVYVSKINSQLEYEYIQVKTTENNNKWSYTEITKLDGKKKDSSLAQKSLLCDINGNKARFKIVSKRGIYKDLEFLTLDYDQRQSDADACALGARLTKKFSQTKSFSGRDLGYWAENLLWRVAGDMSNIDAQNRTTLSQLAEANGFNPTYTQIKKIYHELLSLADNAAVASKITDPHKKIITQSFLASWLSSQLQDIAKKNLSTSKPYLSKPEPFLVEFHTFENSSLRKSLRGYDIQYDFEEWRGKEFAKHLVDWLPEFALKPSELVSFGHHNARHLIAKAQSKINSSAVQKNAMIAELILHSLLRSTLNSEPIACKVFYIESGNFSAFGNAHIVHYPPPKFDELWLGQAKLIPAVEHDIILDEISKNLELVISKTALSKEREIVVTLREANHLLPVTQQLEQALMKNSKVEDLLQVLCFPVMLAYDSHALSKGYSVDYLKNLKEEIFKIYENLSLKFKPNTLKVKIILFMIPIENISLLAASFDEACKVA